ncbi:MAG TPA: hypothetical protein VF615_17590 [Longimicrobiaceae bacterium]|jgi:hypothetical protein
MPGWSLPEPTLARTLLLRSLAYWPGVRLLLLVPVLIAMAARGEPVSLALLLAPLPLFAVPVAAALALLEAWRRHEHLMFANLGTGPAGMAALAAAPPLLGELALVAWAAA